MASRRSKDKHPAETPKIIVKKELVSPIEIVNRFTPLGTNPKPNYSSVLASDYDPYALTFVNQPVKTVYPRNPNASQYIKKQNFQNDTMSHSWFINFEKEFDETARLPLRWNQFGPIADIFPESLIGSYKIFDNTLKIDAHNAKFPNLLHFVKNFRIPWILNLVIRSFLQECREYEWYNDSGMSTMSTRYKMHDIVHNFAQSITKARHLGYSTASQFPPSVDISKNLHTVIFFNPCDYNMSNLVQNFSHLRLLTLTLGMEIPDTIGNLIHLRYLNLIWCKKIFSSGYLKWELPETICNLCNLQFLRLDCSNISILPQKIGKLINLRLLTGGQLVIPREIGRLTSLRTLDNVLISDKDSERCEFEGLKNLNHLRDLSLSFGRTLFPRPDRRRIESNLLIFNALEPPQDLEKLHISLYEATTMSPIWLASLTNLKELRLDDAMELMSLPPLGKILPCLESLTIASAWRLEKVGVEILGIESGNKKEDMKIFPNLKYLTFYFLCEWEEWIGGKEDEDCITIMPHLQRLNILYYWKLKSLPDFLRTTPLKELEVHDCPIIKKRCQRETGEDWHNISHIPIIKLTNDPDDPEDMTR